MDKENLAHFEQEFKQILKAKKVMNIIKGRFDLEPIKLNTKPEFVIQLLSSLKSTKHIIYKIAFWEEDIKMKNFFDTDLMYKKYEFFTSYKNGKIPGIIFLDDEQLDVFFLNLILKNHFNFEMAKEPSLNLRIQICIDQQESQILLDIYDDRGFDYYFKLKQGLSKIMCK